MCGDNTNTSNFAKGANTATTMGMLCSTINVNETNECYHTSKKHNQEPINNNYKLNSDNQKTPYIIDTIPKTDTQIRLDSQQYPSSIGEIGEFNPEKPINYIEPITTVGTTTGDSTNIPDSWLKLTA